ANKIGTYGVAVLAHAHGVPFYVAAPISTIDPATASGAEIVIEQRGADEITSTAGVRTVPRRAEVYNPAFDVTPARLVTALVTDAGVVAKPTIARLRTLLASR
ncbi:MAG: S-methyl-5-thioribose-1-phosphate isomerase, partial [Acidimicrobiia bacterium]